MPLTKEEYIYQRRPWAEPWRTRWLLALKFFPVSTSLWFSVSECCASLRFPEWCEHNKRQLWAPKKRGGWKLANIWYRFINRKYHPTAISYYSHLVGIHFYTCQNGIKFQIISNLFHLEPLAMRLGAAQTASKDWPSAGFKMGCWNLKKYDIDKSTITPLQSNAMQN